MNAEEYFNKEYGNQHIESVVNMGDLESLYGLMEEYANLKLKESEVSEETLNAKLIIRRDYLKRVEMEYWNKMYEPSKAIMKDMNRIFFKDFESRRLELDMIVDGKIDVLLPQAESKLNNK